MNKTQRKRKRDRARKHRATQTAKNATLQQQQRQPVYDVSPGAVMDSPVGGSYDEAIVNLANSLPTIDPNQPEYLEPEYTEEFPRDLIDQTRIDLAEQATAPAPTRGRCPECNTSQKLTKAGLVGKHGDCPGVGSHPAA